MSTKFQDKRRLGVGFLVDVNHETKWLICEKTCYPGQMDFTFYHMTLTQYRPCVKFWRILEVARYYWELNITYGQ